VIRSEAGLYPCISRVPSLQRAGDFSGREVATDSTETELATNEENPEIPSKVQENQGFMSGETGIRTLGTLAGTPVFKTGMAIP
jgi:hypothetical protein